MTWVTRATFRVFKLERKLYGCEDIQFLERVFQKLLLNFTWYVMFQMSSISIDLMLSTAGGSIAKTQEATMFSKAVSLGLIILVFSIDQRLCRLAACCVKQMERPGWRSIL